MVGVEVAPMHRVRQVRCPGGAYFMPLRSTWLAAMSMTLMMKAMAKAQIRLLRTHVWRICWLEQAVATHQGAPEKQKGTVEQWNQELPALLHGAIPMGWVHRDTRLGAGKEAPDPLCKPLVPPLLKQLTHPGGPRGQALTLHVHGALLSRAQVALLLRHDNVLDVLHGQVLTESVVEQPLQLVHCQLLHVALGLGETQCSGHHHHHSPRPAPAATQVRDEPPDSRGMETTCSIPQVVDQHQPPYCPVDRSLEWSFPLYRVGLAIHWPQYSPLQCTALDPNQPWHTFQKTVSKSVPWNLSGIPEVESLGPRRVTNSSKSTWPSPRVGTGPISGVPAHLGDICDLRQVPSFSEP